MHPPYRYFNVNVMPLIAIFLIGKGPWIVIAGFVLCFAIHAMIDAWLVRSGYETKIFKVKDPKNYSHEHYNLPLYFSCITQLVLTLTVLFYPYQTMLDAITSAMVAGLACGIMGMSAGHELVHRTNTSEKIMAMVILHSINYAYFSVEHLWHHIYVGTDQDADSAIEGESLYKFLARVIIHGYILSWKWSLKRKQMIRLTFIQSVIYLSIWNFIGFHGIVIYTILGLISIIMLKWADYIEHYGLRRSKIDEPFEKVNLSHSWSSKNTFTNIALFNLAEHAPHHMNGGINYYELAAPVNHPNTLAYGHTTLMLKALIPKYWYQFMAPKLEQVKKFRGSNF